MSRGCGIDGGARTVFISKRKKPIFLAALSAVAVLLPDHHASAASDTWSGATNAWSVGTNWTGGNSPPQSNDALIFGPAGAGGTNLNDDLTASTFNISSITFSSTAPAYNISGNAFNLTGGITDNSAAAETINNSFSLGANQTFYASNAAGVLTLNGNITGTGITLTTNGGTGGAGGIPSNTIFTGNVSLLSLVAEGNTGNGQIFANNPTTTFNNAALTATGNVLVGRSNLVFTGTTVANVAGSIAMNGGNDWARATISGSANVTCTSFNISDGVTGGFNLGGGTLTTGSIYGIESTDGTYANHNYFNGTQMVANQNNASFLNITKSTAFAGASTGYVDNGGAIFNSSGFNIGTGVAFVNDTGNVGSLTKLGTGSLTLSGASTITGNVNINGGTLIANFANTSATPTGSSLGAPNTAHNVNVNNGGTLNFNVSNVLGINSNVGIAEAIVVNTGGIVNNTNGSSNTLGPVTLNGGTIAALNGSSGTSQAFYFRQAVTVTGSSASTLSSTGANAGFNLVSGAGTNFNVGVTGAVGGDLLVTGNLVNTATGANGALTKTGAGTMVLSGSNSYSGNTNVSAGTLTFANASSVPSSIALINSGTVNFNSPVSAATLNGTSTGVINLNSNLLTLSGGGTYRGSISGGPVSVTGGTMIFGGSASLGGTLTNSATVSLQDGAINTVAVGGALTSTGGVLNFDLGGNGTAGTADKLTTVGAATITGTNTINLDLIAGQTITSGSYTLLTTGGGLAAGGSSFTIATKPAGFNTYSLSSSTTTAEILTIAANPAVVGTDFWTGLASSTGSPTDPNNLWGYGASLTTPKSNWSTTSNGLSDPLQVPGSQSDVIFTAANAAPTAGNVLLTTMDGSYAVHSLTFASPTSTINAIGINTSGNTLTIGANGVTVAASSLASGTISGTGAVVLNGTQSWSNNNATLGLNVSTGISALSGATTLSLNGTGTGGVVLGGAIGDGGGTLGLNINQSGTTQVNGNNTFTGGVTINNGIVQLGNAGALNSTTPNSLTFGSGSTGDLQLNGNSVSVSSLNTNATPGTTVLENANATAASLTATLVGANTFAGTVRDGSGGGALSLALAGTGSLTLSGSIGYTGTTTVSTGTVLSESGTDTTTGTTTVNSGGTIVLAGNSTATGGLIIHDGAILQLQANAANTTAAVSDAAGNRPFNTGGNAAIQLSNGNGTTVSSALIQLRADSSVTFANTATGNGTGNTTLTFDVNNLTPGNTGNTLSFGGLGTYQTNINVTGGNNYTFGLAGIINGNSSFVNFNASSANLTVGDVHNTSTITFLGPKNSAETGNVDSGGVTMAGSGVLTLSGTSAYTGITRMQAGITNVAFFNDEGNNSPIGTAGLDTGANVGLLFEGGTLQYTGATAQSTNRQIRIDAGTVGTIDASGAPGASLSFTATTASNLFESPGTRTLQLTGSNTDANTFAIPLSDQASNPTSFIKSGTGKWTLTGVSNYSGSTLITGGTLTLGSSGNVTNSSLISVSSGAVFDVSQQPAFALATTGTLAGSGTVIGYSHTAGTLSPGGTGTVGTLSFTNGLNLGGGVLRLDLNGTSTTTGGGVNDLAAVTGNLNLSAGTTTTLSVSASPTPALNSIYTIITYSGTLNTDGQPHLVAPNRAYSVITTVPGAVELKYTGGAAANLVWNSSSNQNWDTSTGNWYNTGTSSRDLFFSGDNVVFNDSTSSPVNTPQTNINLTATLLPSSVTVNSNTANYTFGGSGSIGGSATLSKNGSSILTISNANNYSGDTNINGGTVVLTNTAGNGLGTGNLNISGGATVQIGDGGADGAIGNSAVNDSGSLVYNSTTNINLAPAVAGNGSLTIEGSTTFGLGNVNTYSGGTNIVNGATVNVFTPTAFGSGLVTINGGTVILNFGPGGTTGYTYPNNFNLSGAAIHTGGNKTHTITGAVNLIGDTSIAEDGGSSVLFASTVTSATNNSLTLGGGGATFQGNVALGTGLIISGGTVQLQPAGATTITVSSSIIGFENVRHNGAGTTILSASNTYSGGTTVSSGTLTFAVPNALPNFSALNISAAATATAANYSAGIKNTLFTSSLSIAGATGAWTGELDLGNNDLVIQNGNVAQTTDQVRQAFNGGAWNGGGGITSSSAAADSRHLTTLGVIQNSSDGTTSGPTLYNSFDNATSASSSDVLVKYTYYGDTDLNGEVDASDYSRIDNAFVMDQSNPTALTGWFNGDFNYDGVINGSDYTLIDNAFNSQGAQISDELAASTAQIADAAGGSAVPEPTSLTLIAIGAAGLLGRRRRLWRP